MNSAKLTRTYGIFLAAAGLWPVAHMRSFEAVTGPKADRWLVKTVGLLLASIGGTLLAGSRGARPPRELLGLGLTTALSLGAIDLYYGLRGRISRIYLLDGLLQGVAATGFARAR